MRKLYRGKGSEILSLISEEEETLNEAVISAHRTVEEPTQQEPLEKSNIPNTPQIDLYLSDCMDFFATIEDKSADMVFFDPPYFLSNGGQTCKNGEWASVDKGEWDKSEGVEIDHEKYLTWLTECQRVLKDTGTIWVTGTYHCIYSVGYAMQKLGFHTLNDITWYKPDGPPNKSCRQFAAKHENVIWASPSRGKGKLLHTYNYKSMKAKNRFYVCCKQTFPLKAKFCSNCGNPLSVIETRQPTSKWEINTPTKREKLRGYHPTQKSIRVIRDMLEASTNPGDLVIDPFIGSGTTPVACLLMGRRFKGCDNGKANIDLTRERLAHPEDVEIYFDGFR